MKQDIRRIIKRRIVILDGATGTELQLRGMPQGVCPEQWCLQNPKVLSDVHAAYCQAGADVIYTASFGANRMKLKQYNIREVVSLNKRLALLAKKAAAGRTLVAGDIGPTGLFVQPFGSLAFDEAVDIFKEQARGLLSAGVDLFVIETMMDIQEARAALIAVKELADIFTIVTMTYDRSGRTLNGTDPLSALVTLQSLGANAVGCNCSSGPKDMKKILRQMKPYAAVPLVAKPNAGMPQLVANKTTFRMKPAAFSACAVELARSGAAMIGGCCGTRPPHIQYLKKALGRRKPVGISSKTIAALSSSRKTVIFEKQKKVILIGEKINPSGKKQLRDDLISGRLTMVRSLAKEQELAGACVLDVNVGVAGQDESKLMQNVISFLSVATELPLAIDSSDPSVVEKALRFYPGRALVNSIPADAARMKKLFSLAKKYGAMFILLPLTGKRLPYTFGERRGIIQNFMFQAQKAGFTKEDIVIDGLAMAISCNPQAAVETLKTISWCKETLRCRTVVGLSNISFGFPNRRALNRAFLRMAVDKGLTMVIADPRDKGGLQNALAQDVLLNKSGASSRYIRRYSSLKKTGQRKIRQVLTPIQLLYEAVIDGNKANIADVLLQALRDGHGASELIQEVMTPAIIKVGELFDERKYFLPQLIASAEAMKAGIVYLEPYLEKEKRTAIQKGIVLLATVSGDIHDIGKNIVGLLLKNHGFKIVDMGKDVSCAKIIAAIRRHKPDIVGLSALMTTTMVNMAAVIQAARDHKLSCAFMVGGAVVSESYAKKIGARYARDGVAAVRLAEVLAKKTKR